MWSNILNIFAIVFLGTVLWEFGWFLKSWCRGRTDLAGYQQVFVYNGLYLTLPHLFILMFQFMCKLLRWYGDAFQFVHSCLIDTSEDSSRQCCNVGRCCDSGYMCVAIDSSAVDDVAGDYLFPYDTLCFSFVSTASAIAFLGTTATWPWKCVFLLFIASQLLLRAASMCGLFVVLLSDSGGIAPIAANTSGLYNIFMPGSDRLSTQLGAGTLLDMGSIVGLEATDLRNGTSVIGGQTAGDILSDVSYSSGGKDLLIAYIVVSAVTSLFFNSRYALGLSQTTAPIMSVLNIFVAIDISDYSLISAAVPRPPRLSFFLFRMVDMSLCLMLFMQHLDQSVLPDAFKFVVVFLLFLCPTLYCVCLLVPHSDVEPLSQGVARAMKHGAVKNGFYRAQHRDPNQQEWGKAAKNGWALGSVLALIVRFFLFLLLSPAHQLSIVHA